MAINIKFLNILSLEGNRGQESSGTIKFNNEEFVALENYVDLIADKKKISDDKFEETVYKRALECWGDNLHNISRDTKVPAQHHHANFYRMFGNDLDLYRGDCILEIGVGAGFDIHNAAAKNPTKSFIGLDLGSNVFQLSLREKNLKNLFFIRGNALNLPLADASIDTAVSYGVFHHTPDPQRCVREAFRVLKPGGQLVVYLYKNHEDNFLKWLGICGETLLMKFTSKMSIRSGTLFCQFLAPFMLLFFSWPAYILKLFPPTANFGQKFPLHWGTTPSSIMGDLKDRLLASINFRYSKTEFTNLFKSAGFSKVEVKTNTTGHYAIVTK